MQPIQFIHYGDPRGKTKVKVYTGQHNRRMQRQAQELRRGATLNHTIRVRRLELPHGSSLDADFQDRTSTLSINGPGTYQIHNASSSSVENDIPQERSDAVTPAPASNLSSSSDLEEVGAKYGPNSLKARRVRAESPFAPRGLRSDFFTILSKISDTDRYAMRFFLLDIPEKTWPNSPINPSRDWFFPCLTAGLVGFHGALYYSLACQAFSSRATPTTQMLEQRDRLVGFINRALQSPEQMQSDDLMHGLVHMIAVESRLGRLGHQWGWSRQYEGLMRMVEVRGGFEQFSGNVPLAGVLTWAEITLPRPARCFRTTDTIARAENDAFINFMTRLLRLAQDRLTLALDPAISALLFSPYLVKALFTPMVLIGDPGSVWGSRKQGINRRSQLASLLYCAHVMCNFRGCPQATLDCLTSFIATLVTASNFNSRTPLIFFLFQDAARKDMSRLWWLLRALRVVHRLEPTTTETLHELLLDLVMHRKKESEHLRDVQNVADRVRTDLRHFNAFMIRSS